MRIFSARDAARSFGALLDAADSGPVMIHRNGRPRAVVIGHSLFKDYEAAYGAAQDERLFSLLERSVTALAEGKLGTGQRALAMAKRLRLGEEKGSGA